MEATQGFENVWTLMASSVLAQMSLASDVFSLDSILPHSPLISWAPLAISLGTEYAGLLSLWPYVPDSLMILSWADCEEESWGRTDK